MPMHHAPCSSPCPPPQCIEIDAELPGASQLSIELMDRDTVGSDDLIGATVIDLEDRCGGVCVFTWVCLHGCLYMSDAWGNYT